MLQVSCSQFTLPCPDWPVDLSWLECEESLNDHGMTLISSHQSHCREVSKNFYEKRVSKARAVAAVKLMTEVRQVNGKISYDENIFSAQIQNQKV